MFEQQLKHKKAENNMDFLRTLLKESKQIRKHVQNDRSAEIEHEKDHLKKQLNEDGKQREKLVCGLLLSFVIWNVRVVYMHYVASAH